jgi:uridine monophosphate synthetase
LLSVTKLEKHRTMASKTPPHPILTQTFPQRSSFSTHPLSKYLLRLMDLKQSNLCLSADVSTAQQLLSLASACGPSIVLLKTHYDLISNWDYSPSTGTAARLQALARKHGFLIFEDRKFGDIGNTVQLQYTEGTARIVEWAHITNVNMVPGKASVDALAQAARRWRERKRFEVRTEIGVGTPRPESLDSDLEEDDVQKDMYEVKPPTPVTSDPSSTGQLQLGGGSGAQNGRKASIVSITTVSQHFEPANSPRTYSSTSLPLAEDKTEPEIFPGIEEAPLERGLLILAQMSSKGHFMNAEYTSACIEAARENKDFVIGFVCQENLNREEGDAFLCTTPGCQLPPAGEDEDAGVQGDGLGQQYNTPRKIVVEKGCDVIIVGRGIIKADDPRREAERYRRKGWEAYLERVGEQ